METSKYLSEENKKEVILEILSSTDNSDKILSRLKAIDPHWSKFIKEEAEETPVSVDLPRKEKIKSVSSPKTITSRNPKPKNLNSTDATNKKQVQIRWGIIITRLPTSIGAMDGEEELVENLKNLKCPDYLYEVCLDEAYRRGWPGFSCVNCKNFH